MTQNLFTVEKQEELNAVIHRPKDNCTGDCEWCAKFHKANKLIKALTEKSIHISLTANEEVIVPKGYYNVWCAECSDGENNTFYECCDWAERHAKGRHGATNQ
jgi:hypothetical protein